ncbi:MAG: RNA ligase RtcB family protein [Neomegalonema sp.]|nr:RNA ligase RtcB family protein [Neomegalonema sp.]
MGFTLSTNGVCRIVASEDSWIESKAVAQLEQTAASLGMISAVGLPDLHPGKGIPNGAAFLHAERIYPHLIGEDVGCGYALFRLDTPRRKLKLDRAVERLATLETAAEQYRDAALEAVGAKDEPNYRRHLGTVGGGNHFVELQMVENATDEAEVATDELLILVHSGSRGLGGRLFRDQTGAHGSAGFDGLDTPEAQAWRARHDDCVRWAKANRLALAMGAANRLGAALEPLFDAPHNLVEPAPDGGGWLHRKGVQSAALPQLVVPGSRGDASHLVRPIAQADALWSIAHGAGRKWARSEARGRLGKKRTADLETTALGSRVICGDRALLFEEAPEAYKSIDRVLADLVEAGLAVPLARLRPLATYKLPPAEARRATERTRQNDKKRGGRR